MPTRSRIHPHQGDVRAEFKKTARTKVVRRCCKADTVTESEFEPKQHRRHPNQSQWISKNLEPSYPTTIRTELDEIGTMPPSKQIPHREQHNQREANNWFKKLLSNLHCLLGLLPPPAPADKNFTPSVPFLASTHPSDSGLLTRFISPLLQAE